MNVVVVTESLIAFFVGVRSIVRVRITQKRNHPLLSFRICLELETLYVVYTVKMFGLFQPTCGCLSCNHLLM